LRSWQGQQKKYSVMLIIPERTTYSEFLANHASLQ